VRRRGLPSAPYSGAFERRLNPPRGVAVALGLAVLAAYLANGRPIGSGDARPTERVAASLVSELDFDLDEYPEVTPPFAREVDGHRLSIYPVLSGLLAAPVFLVAKQLFALDETGTALAGKLAASLLSAAAVAVFFLALGRRQLGPEAGRAALVLGLGTGLWATSQALWQHPAAVLFICLAMLFLVRAEEEPHWAARAGLPLSLVLAARHADVGIVAVLSLACALRWPRQLPRLLLWALPGVVFVLGYQWVYFGSPWSHGFSGALDRFDAPLGVGHAGLLVSPAKGLLVFTPIAAIAGFGLLRALGRSGERASAVTFGAACLAHWLLMGLWGEWHGGRCWGPRLMTDALPLLFFFLPRGLERAGRLGAALAAVSIGVQALGAFSYDYRWERVERRRTGADTPPLWNVVDSPIPFHLRERVVIAALPGVRDGRAVVHRHPFVVLGAKGFAVGFTQGRTVVSGEPATLADVHLQRGAFVDGGSARLRGRWAGLFLRVLPEARSRPLQLRLIGSGAGTLYVGESTFWSAAPTWSAYPISGRFDLRHDYDFARSGGGDLLITLGRARGEADLEAVRLVPR
jgi:hypothetical protein